MEIDSSCIGKRVVCISDPSHYERAGYCIEQGYFIIGKEYTIVEINTLGFDPIIKLVSEHGQRWWCKASAFEINNLPDWF